MSRILGFCLCFVSRFVIVYVVKENQACAAEFEFLLGFLFDHEFLDDRIANFSAVHGILVVV